MTYPNATDQINLHSLTTVSPKMKENNGHAARRKLLKKLGIVLCVFTCLIGALIIAESKVTDVQEEGKRQSLFNKIRRARTMKTPVGKEYSRILAADLHLVDIDVDARELRRSSSGTYEGVYGVFCKLNFKVHKEDPSSSK